MQEQWLRVMKELTRVNVFLFKKILLFSLAFILLCRAVPAAAALVSLEHDQRNPAAQELYDTRQVLCSKETKPLSAPFVVRQHADKARGVLVSHEEQGFTGTFIVRQESGKPGEALAAKPAELDMRIVRLINNEHIKSIEDYAKWLQEHVTYKSDEGADSWALPEETLTRGYGDCEDFAFLNAAVLRVFGYIPEVLGLAGGVRRVNHAICAFKKGNEYYWFDNSCLKSTDASSKEALAKHIVQRQGYAYMFEINLEEKSRHWLSQDAR